MVSGREEKMNPSMMYNDLTFRKKSTRIDWRKIASIDLDRVARELDVCTLQDNIDQITFCNIENEIESGRIMDPNYIKLFKLSQLTIEYLMHSQNYLTDVIGTIEVQLNTSLTESDELKKLNEKLKRELLEVKKENKKRRKMIETQQTLMSATTSNYHQCAYCSKVFLNVSYLQAHMNRRHSDISVVVNQKQTVELEKELDRLKERLKITESDLMIERNARLGFGNIPMNSTAGFPVNISTQNSVTTSADLAYRQLEETKNREIIQLRSELDRIRDTSRHQVDLNERNMKLETMIKELQDRIGKPSNVGWIKDDIDLEKDTVLNQLKEIEKYKETIKSYQGQIKHFEESKANWKNKESALKKQIKEREEKIVQLQQRLKELQSSLGQNENESAITINELQIRIEKEIEIRSHIEKELAELKSRPPPITPRGTQQFSRTPSPPKYFKDTDRTQQKQPLPSPRASMELTDKSTLLQQAEIYLSDYCPLTLKAVQRDPNHLSSFKATAIDLFESNLDELGIHKNEKGLSENDYKLKMRDIQLDRRDMVADRPSLKGVFQEISDLAEKYAKKAIQSNLRSSQGSQRVTFKRNIVSKVNGSELDSHNQLSHRSNNNTNINNSGRDRRHHHARHPDSEETDDDVSLSNAMESETEDDTEPTRSYLNDNSQRNNSKNGSTGFRASGNQENNVMDVEELSVMESMSELLSEKSNKRKKTAVARPSSSNVNETRKQIEKQLDTNSRQPKPKPSPNAVPIGFRDNDLYNKKDDDSFESVTDLDNDTRNQRPKSGMRSSLHDSNSSSVWVSETQTEANRGANNNHNNNHQAGQNYYSSNQNNHHTGGSGHVINKSNDFDRPPTANSLKTSNFDSADEVETIG